MGNFIFSEKSSSIKKEPSNFIAGHTNKYDRFWRGIKTQTCLKRIATPPYREKIFYTFDSMENKVSIYHPQEGLFFLSKSNFELIDKKVRKLLTDNSSGDQFLLLPPRELCGVSIMKDFFNWQSKVK